MWHVLTVLHSTNCIKLLVCIWFCKSRTCHISPVIGAKQTSCVRWGHLLIVSSYLFLLVSWIWIFCILSYFVFLDSFIFCPYCHWDNISPSPLCFNWWTEDTHHIPVASIDGTHASGVGMLFIAILNSVYWNTIHSIVLFQLLLFFSVSDNDNWVKFHYLVLIIWHLFGGVWMYIKHYVCNWNIWNSSEPSNLKKLLSACK